MLVHWGNIAVVAVFVVLVIEYTTATQRPDVYEALMFTNDGRSRIQKHAPELS